MKSYAGPCLFSNVSQSCKNSPKNGDNVCASLIVDAGTASVVGFLEERLPQMLVLQISFYRSALGLHR